MESRIDIVADIGGTHARLAQIGDLSAQGRAELLHISKFSNDNFSGIESLIKTYLESCTEQDGAPEVGTVCLAVAGPVDGDIVKLVNRNWSFSQSALAALLGAQLHVLNDFSAQGWWLRDLHNDDVDWLQTTRNPIDPGLPRRATRTVAGPGTGFGSASLTAGNEVLESEPGHCAFAPVNLHEAKLLETLWQHFPRVSVEHLLSGPGLANLFMAHGQLRGEPPRRVDPREIAEAARNVEHPDHSIAAAVMKDFSAILGSVCGDIALSMGSQSGFFLSGGLIRKLGPLVDRELFVSRFCDKGPFSEWNARVPVGILTAEHIGLLGCASYISRLSGQSRNTE